jgi:hypothetical protein
MNPNEQLAVPDDNECDDALQQALAIKVPNEKLIRLTQSHPPPASWYQEELAPPEVSPPQ